MFLRPLALEFAKPDFKIDQAYVLTRLYSIKHFQIAVVFYKFSLMGLYIYT